MIGYSYRTRYQYLDATQWTGEIGKYPWKPGWFVGALNHTDNETHGKIVRVGDRLQVATPTGTVMAGLGDWIIQWASTKALEVVPDAEFEKRFEEDEKKNARIQSWRDKKPVTKSK